MNEERLTSLENKFNEYQNALYSTIGVICDLVRRVYIDHGFIDLEPELEERIASIESKWAKNSTHQSEF